MSLTSRERVEIALSHKEPDRAPFDFGATGRAGFTIEAHDALLRALEIDDMTQAVSDPIRRLALPHEALPDHFPHDLVGSWMTPGELLPEDDDGEERYEWRIEHSVEASNEPSEDLDEELPPQRVERATDNFGIRWERRLPASAFRPITTPLAGDIPLARLNAYRFPEPDDTRLWNALPNDDEKATVVGGYRRGLLESAMLLRGRLDVMRDLATGTGLTFPLMDALFERKITYWETRLTREDTRDHPPTFLMETERFDLLEGLPMGLADFQRHVRPRWERLFARMRELSPSSVILFWCSAYHHRYLAEFVEMGVGAVNLVSADRVEAKGAFLKKEYGDALTFIGGGMWGSQEFLRGSEQAAMDQVKGALDVFAPSGGFIWTPSPVIDATVKPENARAALDTLFEYGLY